jgi:predicted Fe-Mo cluster-binding NifX family protein
VRLGIPVWRDEVSPVFDVAARLLVIDVEEGREIARRVIPLGRPNRAARADRVAGLDIDVLVCGTITRSLEQMLTATGVRVMPLVCGPVDRVARLIMTGARLPREHVMPGHRQAHSGRSSHAGHSR